MKDDIPGCNQWSGDLGVRAIRFFNGPMETAGIGENELAQTGFCERGLRIHGQTKNSERRHTQTQTQVPNFKVDHEKAKIPINASKTKPSLYSLGNAMWFFRLGKDCGFRNGWLSHSSCSACSQTTCGRFDEIPSFLAGLRLGMGSNFPQP